MSAANLTNVLVLTALVLTSLYLRPGLVLARVLMQLGPALAAMSGFFGVRRTTVCFVPGLRVPDAFLAMACASTFERWAHSLCFLNRGLFFGGMLSRLRPGGVLLI